jgi:hypothetical protein
VAGRPLTLGSCPLQEGSCTLKPAPRGESSNLRRASTTSVNPARIKRAPTLAVSPVFALVKASGGAVTTGEVGDCGVGSDRAVANGTLAVVIVVLGGAVTVVVVFGGNAALTAVLRSCRAALVIGGGK